VTDAELGRVLDPFLASFDAQARVSKDPVSFPRRYADPRDAETAAFLAASLAFGRIGAFFPVIGRLLAGLGPSPARGLAAYDPRVDPAGAGGLRYRWIDGEDFRTFLGAVGSALREHGTLESLFARGVRPDGDAAAALAPFLADLRARAGIATGGRSPARGLAFLLPAPAGGSAQKRHHLFLRWMVRPAAEGVDLGLWRCLSPARLVVPLDTHVFRIARALGLTERRAPGLAAAREITARLARLDPADPVKYDFALCHFGVSGRCLGRRVDPLCGACALRPVCRLGHEPLTQPTPPADDGPWRPRFRCPLPTRGT